MDGLWWLRAKQATIPRTRAQHSYRHEVIGRMGSGASNSVRTGVADPPEDWPAAPTP